MISRRVGRICALGGAAAVIVMASTAWFGGEPTARAQTGSAPVAFSLIMGGTSVSQFASCDVASTVEANNVIANSPTLQQLGSVQPAQINCSRQMDGNTALYAWHQMARQGDPQAFQDTNLEALDGQGQVQYSFRLTGSWVSRINYAMAGSGGPAYENVTLTAGTVDRVTPTR
jgi:hypothetical protein